MIDLEWGLSTYLNYVQELEAIKAGVPASDVLGKYKAESLQPYTTNMQGQRVDGGEIANIYMTGLMTEGGGLCSRGIYDMVQDMAMLDSNPTVKGLILEMNSGGGDAVAGHMLRQAVDQFSKPIVVYGHTVGSAAYLAASGANEIVGAGTGSSFGSIGTLIQFNNETMRELNEDHTHLYSSLSTKKNGEVRALMAGDTGPMVERLDELSRDFISQVKATRTIPNKEVFEGGMFMAKQAKKNGLIDNIGTRDKALKILNRHIKNQ